MTAITIALFTIEVILVIIVMFLRDVKNELRRNYREGEK